MKKQITRMAAFLMALTLAFTLLPVDAQAASSVRLNKSRITLYTGGSAILKVTGTSRKAKFISSNKTVATVSSQGKVTAKKAGTATIMAKVGSKKLTCRVTVKKENPKLSKSRITLYTGGTATLKVTGTSRKVKFVSSNKSVAPVSSQGKVTAKKAGTATITAKVGSKKLTCKVTIKKESLKISKNNLSVFEGNSATLRISGILNISKGTYTKRKITWKSSNSAVATVTVGDVRDEKTIGMDADTGEKIDGCTGNVNEFITSTAKIKAKKAGTTTISFQINGGKSFKCKVTVKEKTEAQKRKITIYWNGEITIKEAGKTGLVEWESSNNSIVTVKSTGTSTAVLTGKKVGSTTITAKVDGKIFKKYKVAVKMKTGPVTAKEKAIADYAVEKYQWPDTWYGNSKIKDTGFTVKDLGVEWTDKPENQRLWNTHNKALASARKLLPGRDVHIIDVSSWETAGTYLKNKKAKYIYAATIAHFHGKTKKWAVAWIE